MYQDRASGLDGPVLAPAEAALLTALIDALPSQAALLDARGRVVAVNKAWEELASVHEAGPFTAATGQSFLALCRAEQGESAVEAGRVAAGVRAVLIGTQSQCQLGYACRIGTEIAWLRVHVAAFATGGWTGALMTLTQLSDSASEAPAGEARYRAVFDRNTLPMWVFDPATLRFLEVNEAAIAYFGYSRAEFLQMSLADIRPRDEGLAVMADVVDLDSSGDTAKVWRQQLKSGRIVRTEIHAQWLPWAGAPARLVTAIDVTERLRAAEALAESEHRFRDLTNAISEVFWLSELDSHRLLYVSPAYEKIWGRPTAELYSNPNLWLESVHPEDRGRVERAAKAFPDKAYDLEYRIVRPDGSIRWVSDSAVVVYDDAGKPRRMAAVAQDITNSRIKQDRLRLLGAAVARLNDMVVVTEATTLDEPGPSIVFVNDAFVRRTGYSRAEIIGKSPRVLQGPNTQRDELDRISAALRRHEPVRAELINYKKSGAEYWVELEIVPITDGAGRYTHWVAVERDITRRKLMAEQSRQSQHLEALGQLTGGVAHDFNNLLTVIQGNAELLTELLVEQPRLHKLAALIGEAAERSAELTRRLLAFARKQALDPKAVDLNQLLTGLEALLRRSLGRHIEIDLLLAPDLWLTRVDPGQLENAVLNLAINARDAMRSGGTLTIRTQNVQLDEAQALRSGLDCNGHYVLLTVKDTGTGIAAEHLPHVFEPFFTTKETGKGTGLGLAMVYGFVNQSQGQVAIESAPGEGTRLSIYLPQLADAAATPRPLAADGAVAGRGECVLLVEDDPMVRSYAQSQLQQLGYQVRVAGNGADGLALLRQHPEIDLLFTDVVMPGGMSGRDLAEAAHRLRPQLPVLYTSGYPADSIVRDGQLEAGVLLLAKPYRRRELARKLREALCDV
jgi:PAS domain S-box-containing protein